MYEEYRDRVAFYVVYIQEAHPIDAWQLEANRRDKVLFASPKTDEERSEIAEVCVLRLSIKLPALVDDVQDTVERAYTGWPDRFYVIGKDGRIVHKSGAGPFGFKPDEVAKVLQRIAPTAPTPAAASY
jgi:hypothetical protein